MKRDKTRPFIDLNSLAEAEVKIEADQDLEVVTVELNDIIIIITIIKKKKKDSYTHKKTIFLLIFIKRFAIKIVNKLLDIYIL